MTFLANACRPAGTHCICSDTRFRGGCAFHRDVCFVRSFTRLCFGCIRGETTSLSTPTIITTRLISLSGLPLVILNIAASACLQLGWRRHRRRFISIPPWWLRMIPCTCAHSTPHAGHGLLSKLSYAGVTSVLLGAPCTRYRSFLPDQCYCRWRQRRLRSVLIVVQSHLSR